jgi:tetratricopeptide (TPR) repeat protein
MLWRLAWPIVLGLCAALGAGAVYAFAAQAGQPARLLREGRAALESGDGRHVARCIDLLERHGQLSYARLLRAEMRVAAGRRHLADADAAGAESAFRRALDELGHIHGGPDAGDVTVLAAECLVRLGRRRLATDALTDLARQEPDRREAHRWLAAVYIDLNAPADAIRHLREWGRLDPHAGRPFRWVGFFCKNMNQPGPAAEAYRTALQRQLEPALRSDVVRELAETLMEGDGAYQEALEVLAGCPEPCARQPQVLALRAECLWGLGQAEEAAAAADEALRSAPPSARALCLRAKIHLADGQVDAARVLLDEALRLEPHDLAARQHRLAVAVRSGDAAAVEQQRGLLEESRGHWDQLSRLHREAQQRPWDGPLRRQIAELCLKVNRPAEARLWLQATLACDPDDPAAQQLLARLPPGP